jgi:hypothetical protein
VSSGEYLTRKASKMASSCGNDEKWKITDAPFRKGS